VCTFNGQQCCSEQTLNLFNSFIRPAIDNDVFDFDGAFAGARDAINQLNGETRGTQIYIRYYVRTYVFAMTILNPTFNINHVPVLWCRKGVHVNYIM